MSNVLTALCKKSDGDYQAVHCKIVGHPNSPDVPNLDYTKKVLAAEHQDLEFVDWVYDLERDQDKLRCCFLSPNVLFVKKYVFTDYGIELKTIERPAA